MPRDVVQMIGTAVPVSFSSPTLQFNNDIRSKINQAFDCSCDLRKGVSEDHVNARVANGDYCLELVKACKDAHQGVPA